MNSQITQVIFDTILGLPIRTYKNTEGTECQNLQKINDNYLNNIKHSNHNQLVKNIYNVNDTNKDVDTDFYRFAIFDRIVSLIKKYRYYQNLYHLNIDKCTYYVIFVLLYKNVAMFVMDNIKKMRGLLSTKVVSFKRSPSLPYYLSINLYILTPQIYCEIMKKRDKFIRDHDLTPGFCIDETTLIRLYDDDEHLFMSMWETDSDNEIKTKFTYSVDVCDHVNDKRILDHDEINVNTFINLCDVKIRLYDERLESMSMINMLYSSDDLRVRFIINYTSDKELNAMKKESQKYMIRAHSLTLTNDDSLTLFTMLNFWGDTVPYRTTMTSYPK
jgi:hypothetical protein